MYIHILNIPEFYRNDPLPNNGYTGVTIYLEGLWLLPTSKKSSDRMCYYILIHLPVGIPILSGPKTSFHQGQIYSFPHPVFKNILQITQLYIKINRFFRRPIIFVFFLKKTLISPLLLLLLRKYLAFFIYYFLIDSFLFVNQIKKGLM